MTQHDRTELVDARRWVVKVGSALLTADGRRLDHGVIHGLVQQLVTLRERGCEVVLVSSGAVAAGMRYLVHRALERYRANRESYTHTPLAQGEHSSE